MDNYKPKSLEELDREFFAAREVSSGRSGADSDPLPSVSFDAPERRGEPLYGKPVPQRNPDSLLPEPVFYKPAPMQAAVPRQEPAAPSTDDSMRININSISPPVRGEEERSEAPKKTSVGRILGRLIASLMLAATLLAAAFGTFIGITCNDTAKKIFGCYVCSVNETTASPKLEAGDIAIVRAASGNKAEPNDIIAFYNADTKAYYYRIVEARIKDTDDKTRLTVKYKTTKGETVTDSISAATVLGTADFYLPYVWRAVDFAMHHFMATYLVAGLFIALWVLLLVLLKKKKSR